MVPAAGRINWGNLCRRPEDIVPDGIIDWYALHEPGREWSDEDCPIERAIAEAGRSAHVGNQSSEPPSCTSERE
jgi:hypothetical protein